MADVTDTQQERKTARSVALFERHKLWPITYPRVAAMRFYQSRFLRLLRHDCQAFGPPASSRRGRVLAYSNESLSSYSTVISLVDGSRMRRSGAINGRGRGEECQHFPDHEDP